MKKKSLKNLSLNKKKVSTLSDSVSHRVKGGITENNYGCQTLYISCALSCNTRVFTQC